MISCVENGNVYEFRGEEADKSSLTTMTNGSIFLAVDTLNAYIYDGTAKAWVKMN